MEERFVAGNGLFLRAHTRKGDDDMYLPYSGRLITELTDIDLRDDKKLGVREDMEEDQSHMCFTLMKIVLLY